MIRYLIVSYSKGVRAEEGFVHYKDWVARRSELFRENAFYTSYELVNDEWVEVE